MSVKTKLLYFFRGKQNEKQVEDEGPSEFQVLEEMIRNLQKRERRQAQAFERMLLDLGSKMDNIQVQISSSPATDSVVAFADSFAIYYLRNFERDESLKHIWSKFSAMLEEFGLQLILDIHCPFDDTVHQACDTREDHNFPSGTILEVVRPGLIVRGRIVRPAVVVTSRNVFEQPPIIATH